ncbi:hypothetical protein J2Z17_003644 [Rhizobium halophytocola]|uniref:Phytase-like domain-containing protein n=1 Tax=Rhizobium halophytocola TaxID=735519 RepID=A0ABS4E2N1_9HYPH|nr:esterase-like activity of phytase family protein [Rhizobium halophytocola]MBP1852189.1 hypothetical protein [Rhizobium halophytocola]
MAVLKSRTLLAGVALVLALAGPAASQSLTIQAEPITHFSFAPTDAKIAFVGGLELWSTEPLFGAWSSVRFTPDGTHFIGVLDTGHWLSGRIARDGEGRLSGIDDGDITPMLDGEGRRRPGKWLMDAESVALRGDDVIVGFEQRHRIDAYPATDFRNSRPQRSLPIPFPVRELRANGGLETLVASPKEGPLAGGLLAISEKSVDAEGRLYGGIVDGPMKGELRVVQRDDFDVTDGAFLPDGDLLLLERRFTLTTGVGMRIRRIKGSDIRPGAVLDGAVVLQAGMGDGIDNMEGLDVIPHADGSASLIMVSDDNHSILQRNLMLEFRLQD